MASPADVLHRGSCHCKAVQFEFEAPSDVVQTECNCSICTMKGNKHTLVAKTNFRILQGEEMLTLYTFHTHKAQHLFCKTCGVEAFFIPRINPDVYAVTVGCVDLATITSVKTTTFDGRSLD